MSVSEKWKLPVPSTALLDGGPVFEQGLGREVSLEFCYEGEDDGRMSSVLTFEGVEAYKCTFFRARSASMLKAYDKLVELEQSTWLDEVRGNLSKNGADSRGLVHLMIDFDDGPTYEVLCRSFRVAEK